MVRNRINRGEANSRMRIWTLLIVIAASAGVACQQTDVVSITPQPTDTVALESEATMVVARDTPIPTIEGSEEEKQEATATMAAEPSPSPIGEVDLEESDEQSQSSAEEAIAVNGPYEQTFFRGRSDAPITMIDYSDFL